MKLRPWILCCCCGLASLGATGLAADGKPPVGRGFGLSETNTFEVLSNLSLLRHQGQVGVRQIEENFARALPNGGSKGSLEGVAAPSYSSPARAQVRRRPNSLDQQPDWLKQEQILPGGGSSEWLQAAGLDEAAEQKKKRSTSQFYERLKANETERVDSLSGDDPSSPRRRMGIVDLDAKDDLNLPSAIRSSEDRLKKLLLGDAGDGPLSYGEARVSSPEGPGFRSNGGFSQQELNRQKAYMNEYLKVLNGSYNPYSTFGTANPLNAAAQPGSSSSAQSLGQSPTYNGMDGVAADSKANSGMGLPGTLSSILRPGALPDINDKLNQWNPLYVPPQPELPKPLAPAAVPMMETPRRRF